jgi:ABC-type polysaccharide/polyol phosphate transport system ATPase subunit
LKETLPALVHGGEPTSTFFALRDLSFEVRRGETLGIIGRNGSGKSTVLKLIAGVMQPSAGRVWANGRVAPLIELGACFHPDLTGRENVYLNASILGMKDQQSRRLIDAIVDFAEIEQFIDTPVKRYSSGMSLRLAFSVVMHCEPEILLVDEALAVGDKGFQEKCLGRMREFQRQGVSIVVVTHQLDLVREYCDRALLLDHGRLLDEGAPFDVIERYVG